MQFSNTQFVRAIPVVMALGLAMTFALSAPRGVTANGGDEHRRGPEPTGGPARALMI